MKRSGHADLPLHYGHVPLWLAERMSKLGGAIIESIAIEYGRGEVLSRLSDPAWFQSLGCVLGMDWHSSGITTSVMGALKRSVNKQSKELGIYICGGKGRFSRNTPDELLKFSDITGLNGDLLVRNSRLTAKVDNTAIQDGFQIYLHCFVVSVDGQWTVIQQGMNGASGYARRYHWHSENVKSFIEDPHTFIYGRNQGTILNLVDKGAKLTQQAILDLSKQDPAKIITETRKILLPAHHEVRASDVNIKRLGATLALAHEKDLVNFEDLLLLEGVGPRTLQSLTLVSEVIHGTPSRFNDPARFSFAHGGKDGHPFPVPLKTYDESISVLENSIRKAKIGEPDKHKALQNLHKASVLLEENFVAKDNLEALIEKERKESYKYGGRTVFGKSVPPSPEQLKLF